MPYNNNSFTEDTDAQHSERAHTLANGIGDHGADLLYTAAEIADMQGYADEFDAAYSVQIEETADVDAIREEGETYEATEELRKVFDDAKSYYIQAKNHLLNYIYSISKPDRIITAYGFHRDSPRTYSGLCQMLHTWIRTHESLVVEGDPRVANDAIITNLTDYYHSLDMMVRERNKEKEETTDAYALKRAIFDEHTNLLRFIYTLAILTWRDPDDSRLGLLGFVPASEVWTPGQPEPQPEEFPAWPGPTGVFTLRYWGEGVVEIVYGGVQESTIGWLHRSVPGAEDWIEVNIHLPMNEEDILPFREMHVPIGMWEYRFIPMRGVEKGVASFARIEVV